MVSKGDATRRTILETALGLASELGLEGLTIGTLAKQVGMSKSGLYAHFASKEVLQCAVLDTAAASFVDAVLAPAFKAPRGVPRVRAMHDRWIVWATELMPGGCPFVAAATELDDRPGPARDALVGHMRDVLDAIERAAGIAVREGHFHESLDTSQFAYEFWANLVSYHHYVRLLRAEAAPERARLALEGLLQRASTSP